MAVKQLSNLVQTNTKLLDRIMKTSQNEITNLYKTAESPEEAYQILQIITQQPIIQTAKNSEDLQKFQDNIGKAWQYGMKTGNEAPLKTVQLMEGMIKENVMNYVTKLDNDTKQALSDIVTKTIKDNLGVPVEQRVMPEQLAQMMSQELNGNVARSRMIARTETMRASNLAGWSQNKAEGCTHFIVDNRAESCEECASEFEGEVFTIDQIDVLPPVHPNCACVPEFFKSEDEAQSWSDTLRGDNVEERGDATN